MIGDYNLDYFKWTRTSYQYRELVEMLKLFMADVTLTQVVDSPTRVAATGGVVVKSLVDHCYVTDPRSYSTPKVVTVGDSDHLGQVVSQLARNIPTQPNTIKARVYTRFCPLGFQLDLVDNQLNELVTGADSLEEAD